MRALVFLVCLFTSASAQAQRGADSVTATVQPEVIEVAKPFRYDVTLTTFTSGDLQLKSAPAFGSLEVLGRAEFPQFITINNVSQRVLTISWTLRSRELGTFTIGPPTVVIGSADLRPEAAKIKVVKAGKIPKSEAQKNDQVYVEATRDPSGPAYVGQQVNLNYAIFNDVRMFDPQVRAITDPPLDDFWVETVNDRSTGQRQSVPVRGRLMQRTILRNYAIFPLRAGTAAIDPLGITLATGGFLTRKQDLNVESPALDLEVLPLPPHAPDGFYEGNVGQWDINAIVDSQNGKVGEATSLRLRVTGSGLITRVKLPKLPTIENARFDEPTEDLEKSTRGNLVVGMKTAEYSIIPTAPGTLVVPEITFVYFDPATATYQTRKTAPITLSIADGVLAPETAPVVPLAESATSVTADDMIAEVLSSMGQPVDETLATSRRQADSLMFRVAFFVGLLALFGILLETPLRRWRLRRAPLKNQREKLDRALEELKAATAIDEVAEITKSTIASAFRLEGKANVAAISAVLREHQVADAVIAEFRATLAEIESARFAPVSEQPDIAGLRTRAMATLDALRAPALRAVSTLLVLMAFTLTSALAVASTPDQDYAAGSFEAAGKAWAQAASPTDVMAHFNAGLAFARARQLGPARAELETAAFLNPTDTRIRSELAKVKSIVRLQAIESTRVGRIIEGDEALFWWNVSTRLPPNLLPYATLAALWILVCVLVVWRVTGRSLKTPALIAVGLLLTLTAAWATWHQIIASTHAVVLLESTTEFRDGPSEMAATRKVRGTTAGTLLHATEVRENWIRVALTNEEDTAWVSSSKVHLIN